MTITNNQILADDFSISGTNFLSNGKLIVKGVRTIHKYVNKERTDDVACIAYVCIDPVNYNSFELRVNSTVPVVTAEELREAGTNLFIEADPEAVVAKPTEAKFGNVTVSVWAPSVRRVKA